MIHSINREQAVTPEFVRARASQIDGAIEFVSGAMGPALAGGSETGKGTSEGASLLWFLYVIILSLIRSSCDHRPNVPHNPSLPRNPTGAAPSSLARKAISLPGQNPAPRALKTTGQAPSASSPGSLAGPRPGSISPPPSLVPPLSVPSLGAVAALQANQALRRAGNSSSAQGQTAQSRTPAFRGQGMQGGGGGQFAPGARGAGQYQAPMMRGGSYGQGLGYSVGWRIGCPSL